MEMNLSMDELIKALTERIKNRRFASIRVLTEDVETVISDFSEAEIKNDEIVINFLGGKIRLVANAWYVEGDDYHLYTGSEYIGYNFAATITFSNKGVGM